MIGGRVATARLRRPPRPIRDPTPALKPRSARSSTQGATSVKNSDAIASNEAFSGWSNTFPEPRLCAAIVDRLTFGGQIIETGTDTKGPHGLIEGRPPGRQRVPPRVAGSPDGRERQPRFRRSLARPAMSWAGLLRCLATVFDSERMRNGCTMNAHRLCDQSAIRNRLDLGCLAAARLPLDPHYLPLR